MITVLATLRLPFQLVFSLANMRVSHKNLIFAAVFIFSLITIVYSQVGNSCNLSNTRKAGQCKLISECQSAQKNKLGIRPAICGYYYNEPIVCCEDDQLSSVDDSEKFVFPTFSEEANKNRKRKSEQKCIEYSRNLVHNVLAIPLVTNPKPIVAQVPQCDYNGLPLIVGGSPAEPGEFPHMAALGYRNINNQIEWNCGGTLISEQYVLTAAHCTNSRIGPPVVVRLGELNLERDDDGAEPVNYQVAEAKRHPDYKVPEKYNDIGLLRLRTTVSLNKFIRPACLWNSYKINQTTTIATGWGHTEYGGVRSEKLLKVSLDIIDNDRCNTFYQVVNRHVPNGIEKSMMCAGVLKGGKDTCQGDSGGPIQVTNQENQCIFYIVGVTSFGKGCASANSPAVYTRVSEFIPWIESIVWP